MNKFFLSGSLLALMAFNAAAQDAPKKTQNEPPKRGIHWAKGHVPAARSGGNPDMTWHSGAIMTTAATNAIFWGPSWATSPGDKISGMDKWFSGFGSSHYAGTSDEYTGTNGQVSSTVSYGGHFVDGTTASGGSSTSAILAEVCKVIPSPVVNGFYAVYTDIPRGIP